LDARVALVTRLDAEETKLVGDRAELVAALLNLGFNARDAMEDGGTLTIATENVVLDEHYCAASPFALTPGEYVQITVRDTGHGMDPATLERAFEPFFTTKPTGVGTGLGLPAVYGAVSRHRGALAVYSEAGTGSVFHVFLPVRRGLVIAAYQPSEEERGHGEGVLVVDDEEIIRETARFLLEALGYRVFLAAHGEEGIEQFVAHQAEIDVVLLDMIMPRMNGRECFERLRRVDPGVRVLMSSGFTPEAVLRDSVTSGVTGFLKKPYRMSELGAALRAVLEPRRSTT
ncbi:MAG: response regulator, partial [Myxococcales bacterium]|nr:response regulator [Myxococcales bacterium]